MAIITQNYNFVIENLIKNKIGDALQKINLEKGDSVYNYIEILSTLDAVLAQSMISIIQDFFQKIDDDFCRSSERKRKYDIKDYCERRILTVFGEVTYKRHFYKNKFTGKSYCFLDRKLGLKKYQYFDPQIRSLVVAKAAETSISDACRQINNLIGTRVGFDAKTKFLNRQSARNIILESSVVADSKEELETPEEIYIIADEKFIATQNNPNKTRNSTKEMYKSIVVFDGYTEYNERRKLENKMVFTSRKDNIITQSLDYISSVYDTDKIKRVFVMGDGAKWIKALPQHYKFNANTKVYYCLDKFHFKQSLHHMIMDGKLEKKCLKYILKNDHKSFDKIVEFIKKNNPKREEKIILKYNYIINNWRDIQRLYEYKMSCPMESQISHNIASLTSSRPKGYSLTMLDKIIEFRMLKVNKNNIQKLYLDSWDYTEKSEENVTSLDYSIFENKNILKPIYTDTMADFSTHNIF